METFSFQRETHPHAHDDWKTYQGLFYCGNLDVHVKSEGMEILFKDSPFLVTALICPVFLSVSLSYTLSLTDVYEVLIRFSFMLNR